MKELEIPVTDQEIVEWAIRLVSIISKCQTEFVHSKDQDVFKPINQKKILIYLFLLTQDQLLIPYRKLDSQYSFLKFYVWDILDLFIDLSDSCFFIRSDSAKFLKYPDENVEVHRQKVRFMISSIHRLFPEQRKNLRELAVPHGEYRNYFYI